MQPKQFSSIIFACLFIHFFPVLGQNIGDFTSITPGSNTTDFVIPATHQFQTLIQTGDVLTAAGTMPARLDFTGYVPIAGSSTNGYLSINSETSVGGVVVLDIHLTSGLWQVTSSQAIDFSPVVRTGNNCSGAVTPWGTVLTCEENIDFNDANLDGYRDVGWAVEIDPANKTVIDKRWAMGNFIHENATIHVNERTVYQGIDDNTGYLYKFVATTAQDLSSGSLYVYSGSKNGSGNWIQVNNTTTSDRNNTVNLSTSAGGTVFDGIEDVEIGPDGMVYFAVKNENLVYRFQDSDPVTGTAVPLMETFVGNASYTINSSGGSRLVPWGSGNDNLAFDGDGNLWVLQDGSSNYIWVVKNGHTQASPQVEIFGNVPQGAEPTGITFSPDHQYLFMSIQHPSPVNNATFQTDAAGNLIAFDKDATLVISRKPVSTTIQIPADYSTIQAGINASAPGDTILVAPGTYNESLILSHRVVLASWYLTTGDENHITNTIIDAGNGPFVISIPKTAQGGSSIIGFNLQEAEDGILPFRRFNLLHCRITKTSDGIDYEAGSGGLCQFSIFEDNSDDGIDLDSAVNIIIADNIIRNNGNDGIEIRMHDYQGPDTLNIVMTRNRIHNNLADGIQLIDYNNPIITPRKFTISYNYIYNNGQAGIGLMGNEQTDETYEGASIEEEIYVFNNTIYNNAYGLTGGDNLVALNNIFANNTVGSGVRNVDGNSIVAFCSFYNNGIDNDNSNVDNTSTLFSNPLLDSELALMPGSPAIDAGIAQYFWQSKSVLSLDPTQYEGNAPDIGAFESDLSGGSPPYNQIITFNPIPNQVTTDPSFPVTANASSGLAVSFVIVSGPATISGNTITLTGATGTVVVRASQAGDATFNPAPDVERSFTVSDPVSTTQTSSQVASSSDDAEERVSNGSMSLSSSDLELCVTGNNGQLVGMRFNGLAIPQGATIISAYIQFRVDETGSGSVNLTIQGEDSDDAAAFTSSSGNISSRNMTSASVSWSPPAWTSVGDQGPDQQTSELKTVVQEVVDRTGWTTASSMVIIITGSGTRTAESYNGMPSGAPLLVVEYSVGPASNLPPVAGITATPTSGLAPLNVAFSGAPSTDNDGTIVSYSWQFGDGNTGNGVNVNHTYASIGTYTAVLTVTDDNSATATAQQIIVVSDKLNQTISFDPIPNQVTTDSDFSVTANASSGLAVSFVIVSGPATISGNIITLTGATGTVVVRASQAGDATYNPAPDVDRSFTVSDPSSTTQTSSQVASSSDDAEERVSSGSMSLSSSDLELCVTGSNGQLVGMRFNGLAIPQGATIISAYIQFRVDETGSGSVNLTIQGEDSDDAAAFTSSSGNISSRNMTSASVSWSPPAWTSVGDQGPDQQTSELKTVVQEVVDRTGWTTASSMVIIITGSGTRTAESYNGMPSGAPLLVVEYSVGPASNLPPVAGITATPTSGLAPLNVAFSGAPSTDNDGTIVSYSWQFGDGNTGNGVNVNHTYASIGTYTAVLTVTDDNSATATAQQIIVVSDKLNQTISFDPIPNQVTTDSDFSVTANASSGLAVSFVIVSGPATISGNIITLTGATGTVVVRASQAGNATYNPAPDVDRSFTVSDPSSTTQTSSQVASSSDDAEERASSGRMSLSSSDLELVDVNNNEQLVGMRFNGLAIPQGATIVRAYIQFRVDETESGSVNLTIQGEDSDDAAAFTSSSGNISSRNMTSASVSWSPPSWPSVGDQGPDQQTSELKTVVQEVVDRPGWTTASSMVIIITGSGTRIAESYNGMPAGAPELVVEFQGGPPARRAIPARAEVSLYPNPFDDHLFFQLNHPVAEWMSVSVINATGQTVLKKDRYPANQKIKFKTGNWAEGLFWFIFRTDNGQLFQVSGVKQ